jgi:hypothetical protein
MPEIKKLKIVAKECDGKISEQQDYQISIHGVKSPEDSLPLSRIELTSK